MFSERLTLEVRWQINVNKVEKSVQEGYKLVPHHTNLLNSMTLQTLSSQIPFKIRNLTDFKAFFLDMLTEFHLLVPVKI